MEARRREIPVAAVHPVYTVSALGRTVARVWEFASYAKAREHYVWCLVKYPDAEVELEEKEE